MGYGHWKEGQTEGFGPGSRREVGFPAQSTLAHAGDCTATGHTINPSQPIDPADAGHPSHAGQPAKPGRLGLNARGHPTDY